MVVPAAAARSYGFPCVGNRSSGSVGALDEGTMAYFFADCPRCGALGITLEVDLSRQVETDDSNQTYRVEMFCVCRDCRQTSIFSCDVEFGNSMPGTNINNLENYEHFSVPQPVTANLPLIDVPEGVEGAIASAFRQGGQCKRLGLYDAAGAMLRKTLDLATKEILKRHELSEVPVLAKRIDKLADEGIIPKRMKEFAHRVRVDGNEAVHGDTFSSEEVEDLEILATEFLRQTFESDARLSRMEARRPLTRKP